MCIRDRYGLEHPGGLRRIALSVILSLLFLLTIYLSVVVIFTGDWFFHLLETHLPHPLLRLIPLSALSSLCLLYTSHKISPSLTRICLPSPGEDGRYTVPAPSHSGSGHRIAWNRIRASAGGQPMLAFA